MAFCCAEYASVVARFCVVVIERQNGSAVHRPRAVPAQVQMSYA
jgi:hypothetical protein